MVGVTGFEPATPTSRTRLPALQALVLLIETRADVHYACTGICTYVLYTTMNVNVTKLRQNLPTYLKRVRQGERICVTSRGQVIAELAPPTTTAEEAVLARKRLRGSLVRYEQPFEPALAPKEWTVDQ
jgi:antitoxin (DNA-binding transcriptional repressor) of toxin-antitoxin stability system